MDAPEERTAPSSIYSFLLCTYYDLNISLNLIVRLTAQISLL
jgi:hypothetical protein